MDLDPYRTTCEVCLSDNICAGFEMIAPRTEVWIVKNVVKISVKNSTKENGSIISRGGGKYSERCSKKRRSSASMSASV